MSDLTDDDLLTGIRAHWESRDPVPDGMTARLQTAAALAEAALDHGIPYVVVQPFPDPDSKWPSAARESYRRLLAEAREVVLMQKKAVRSPGDVRRAMSQRDAWITRSADAAIVVWDGADALLGKTVRALEQQVGDEVWIVDPGELT